VSSTTKTTTNHILQRMHPPRRRSIKVVQSITQSSSSSSTRLFTDLWDRMEIEEDLEPQWYLLNCVAGLELDLLQQCRGTCGGLLDVVKFVVPTITKTRSHGAKRMVRDIKVKYQGYVFAKLRLTRDTYLAIQSLTLCRSWMGTINIKGHRKLPPTPQPLSEEEIKNFDLENFKWVQNEQEIVSTAAVKEKERTVIVDTEDYDIEESRIVNEIEEEVQTVYKGLKVEDMIKVTNKGKFYNEDGLVRRLKEGKVLIRFFTYGTVFDEWLDPSEVRKLTKVEILQGLGGPSAPITQRDLDGPRQDRQDRRDQRDDFDSRNQAGAFGGEPRHRRQDRTDRQFRNDRGSDDRRERDNWNWYQEKDRRSREGGYSDGQQHIRGSSDQRQSRGNFWAESDVDSQWGRNNSPSRSSDVDRRRPPEKDWNSFVSKSPAPQKTEPPTKKGTDDFFVSLMSDLSGDVGGDKNDANVGNSGGDRSDDDFFASLISEIDENKSKSRTSTSSSNKEWDGGRSDDDFFASLMSDIDAQKSTSRPSRSSRKDDNDNDDDFFASLEKEIRGGSARSNKFQSTGQSKSNKFDAAKQLESIFAEFSMDSTASGEDDFFASLEKELASDLGEVKKQSKSTMSQPQASDEADMDDFFSSLEMELASDLGGEKHQAKFSKPVPKVSAETNDDDFFSSLEMELSDTMNEVVQTADGKSFDDSNDFFPNRDSDISWDATTDKAAEKTTILTTTAELTSATVVDSPVPHHSSVDDGMTTEETRTKTATKTSNNTNGKSTSPPPMANPPVPHHNVMDRNGLQTRTVLELKDMLRERGLKVSGKKAELIDRLTS
jgi:transcription antitermination factor NusG